MSVAYTILHIDNDSPLTGPVIAPTETDIPTPDEIIFVRSLIGKVGALNSEQVAIVTKVLKSKVDLGIESRGSHEHE